MNFERRAVIDIGTNSVKLLVGDVRDHQVQPVWETSEQTRLGQGFYESRRLQPEPLARTARAVAKFEELAREKGAQSIRVLATSAARDATNPEDLTRAVAECAGLKAQIISGEQEAEWVFQGVTSDPALEGKRLLILDVGGGSTEFIVGEKGHHSFRESFSMGSVRLMELLAPSDPPSLQDLTGCREWLRRYFERNIGPQLHHLREGISSGTIQLVGTGGTVSILARMEHRLETYDRSIMEGTLISRQNILDTMVRLWSLTLGERQKIPGLPPNRADIILMGVAIYEAVISHFHFANLYVSTRGLRFGALLEPGLDFLKPRT